MSRLIVFREKKKSLTDFSPENESRILLIPIPKGKDTVHQRQNGGILESVRKTKLFFFIWKTNHDLIKFIIYSDFMMLYRREW